VTEQGTIIGTFQYMSPEQIEAKELDGRSDIFFARCGAYEMLTGQRAFQATAKLSVASAISEKDRPDQHRKPMTRRAGSFINKCLAKVPDERWQKREVT